MEEAITPTTERSLTQKVKGLRRRLRNIKEDTKAIHEELTPILEALDGSITQTKVITNRLKKMREGIAAVKPPDLAPLGVIEEDPTEPPPEEPAPPPEEPPTR